MAETYSIKIYAGVLPIIIRVFSKIMSLEKTVHRFQQWQRILLNYN